MRMRSFLILALSGILAVVMQTTPIGRLGILPAAPNLILVLVVYLGLRMPTRAGALGAFLLGYLLDTFSGSVPGLHCFTMTLVFAMVYLVSGRLWMQNPVTSLAIMVLACLLEIFTLASYFAWTGVLGASASGLLGKLTTPALLALLVSPLLFTLLDAYVPLIRRKKVHAAD